MGYIKNKTVPIALINRAMKSICKIKTNGCIGTGFFIKVNSIRYLITCFHVVRNAIENKAQIELEIQNKNSLFEIRFNDRFTKCIDYLNIAAIEIKDSDLICKDIECLDYDNNYIKEGYSIYKGLHVFSLSYVYGNDLACSSGQIEKSSDDLENNEFEHSISTEQGSSECPIILISNQMRVIGIHSSFCRTTNLNCGTYIGEIIEILKKMIYQIKRILKGKE